MSTCEWNPTEHIPAEVCPSSVHGKLACPNEAIVSVGGGMRNWHLCEICAAMPEFKRFRKRTPLKRKDVIIDQVPGRNLKVGQRVTLTNGDNVASGQIGALLGDNTSVRVKLGCEQFWRLITTEIIIEVHP